MTEMERALKEVDSATAAVAAIPAENFAEARAAMDRRFWAMMDLAALAASDEVPLADRERALSRLHS